MVLLEMKDILIGLALLAVLVVGIVLVAKVWRKGKDVTPEEAARMMMQDLDRKEEVIQKYSGNHVPFKFDTHIVGLASAFRVIYVEVYGVRYGSIKDAVQNDNRIDEDVRFDMLQFEEQLRILREEFLKEERFYMEKDVVFGGIDGKVRVYKECTIAIQPESRAQLGLPPRMAVDIEIMSDGRREISKIYIASEDVLVNEGMVFDMQNQNDKQSYETLVGGTDIYKDEKKVLAELAIQLDAFNQLVEQGDRVEFLDDGDVRIWAPRPEIAKKIVQEMKNGSNKRHNGTFVREIVMSLDVV